MQTDQPRSINPLRLAKTGKSIDGNLPFDLMERLKGLLLDYSGKLHYSLSFEVDESGLCSIDSEISASVTMACQRCLKPLVIDIQKRNLLGIVNNEDEIIRLATLYEPLLLDDEEVLVIDELVEDELLLAIPLSPLHPAETCTDQQELDRINADAKPKPFAILASLKKDKE